MSSPNLPFTLLPSERFTGIKLPPSIPKR
ncbi:hypothetical protein LINPERHAP1_LOCUS27230 [Linum perenne]